MECGVDVVFFFPLFLVGVGEERVGRGHQKSMENGSQIHPKRAPGASLLESFGSPGAAGGEVPKTDQGD